MNSQILLMNVKFQEMEPLVRQMIQYSHGIAFCRNAQIFLSICQLFNEAVVETLGHG